MRPGLALLLLLGALAGCKQGPGAGLLAAQGQTPALDAGSAWALRGAVVLAREPLGGALAERAAPPTPAAADMPPLTRAQEEAAAATRRASRMERLLAAWDGPAAPAPASPEEELRLAQRLLTALGYYKGPIDGLPGPGSRDALLRFQAIRGLPETGEITPAALAALRASL